MTYQRITTAPAKPEPGSPAIVSDSNNFDEASSSYGNLLLAVFFGCKTGITDPKIGNLVDVVSSKGAGCAMGWTVDIAADGSHSWSSAFWDSLRQGKSIDQAHLDGLNAAKDDPNCKWLTPSEDLQYCNFEKLYSQGSGCKHPLQKGMTNPLSQNVNLNIPETQSQEKADSIQIKMYLAQEQLAIRKFSNKTEAIPKYEKSAEYSYGTLDIYSVENVTFKVNRDTGRIQSQYSTEIYSTSGNNIFNLNQGYPIAEAYAKEKSPEVWANSKETIMKSISQTAKDHDLAYSWRQYIISKNITTNQPSDIAGFNLIDVTLDARDGKVKSYHEWYKPLDTNLNLNPDISEEQAWERAKIFYKTIGIDIGGKSERKNFGLNIAIDENINQCLTYQFEFQQKDKNGFDQGGQIGVDAHNGQVVWHVTIG